MKILALKAFIANNNEDVNNKVIRNIVDSRADKTNKILLKFKILKNCQRIRLLKQFIFLNSKANSTKLLLLSVYSYIKKKSLFY